MENGKVYAVKGSKVFYFETPEDLALRDNVPQYNLVRFFDTQIEGQYFLDAILPFADGWGELRVVEFDASDKAMLATASLAKRTNQSPLFHARCSIGPNSWPVILDKIIGAVSS